MIGNGCDKLNEDLSDSRVEKNNTADYIDPNVNIRNNP